MKSKSNFLRGMTHGIPIMLGYLSVSFGFGISAVESGLGVFSSSVISAVNLTSAGQLAGIKLIAESGTLLQMILLQLTINIRYSLMALSLSQKLDKSFTTGHRLAASYGITDEIFAVCSSQPGMLSPAYMYGVILVSALGWILGTFLGASAGSLLPEAVTRALGIMIYGMFIAIIVPPARKNKKILSVVAVSVILMLFLRYVLKFGSFSGSVMISAIIAAAIGALLFPVNDEEAGEA
ncbi:MAG: AzlC family ABC transporter permease [Alistipes sp.]|nr:AzlC family ABC transporter permease [Alistipes sp.]